MDAPTNAVRLRKALDTVPAYQAGRPAAAREGLTTYKISSNENPYPPLPSVVEVITASLGLINRYPDPAATDLTAALAQHCGVTPAEIVTGTGSVALLTHLAQATCDGGDEIVYAWRSFEAYPIIAAVAGAVPVPVPLDAGLRHDLDAMAAAITDRTRLVLVCTPNNPTGPAVGDAELRAFLAQVPADVVVAIDEAYLEFNIADDAADALAIYRDHPNVCVLRTFSKAHGLAGLRIGYCVAHEYLATGLRKVVTPFGVSNVGQQAALASLSAPQEMRERVDFIVAERERVAAALREQGWAVPQTQANFVWLPLGERTAAFVAAAEEQGLVVRPFAGEGVRCTIAEQEANDRLVEVAAAFGA